MSNNPTLNPLWDDLKAQASQAQQRNIESLFNEDNNRFDIHSCEAQGIFLDYSKQNITHDILKNLTDLLHAQEFETKRSAMFSGALINNTEKRAVLHTALRRPKNDEVTVESENVIPDIHDALDKMKEFSDHVRNENHKGIIGCYFKEF